MCSALNPAKPDTVFQTKDIPYWEALGKYFNVQDKDLFTNSGSGVKSGIQIVLDMNTE